MDELKIPNRQADYIYWWTPGGPERCEYWFDEMITVWFNIQVEEYVVSPLKEGGYDHCRLMYKIGDTWHAEIIEVTALYIEWQSEKIILG